jgi:elongation factor 3
MSIESMLEKLSLGDESSLVEKVTAEGCLKSGLADSIDALAAKCASKKEEDALAGLAAAKALAEGAPGAQAYTKQCLSACLTQASSKSKDVATAAKETAMSICANISPFAMKSLLPQIFAQLPVEKKWQSRPCARLLGHIQQNSTQTARKCPS